MQDYSTDTEEYSAAWDKMNFLLDKYTQAVGELVPFQKMNYPPHAYVKIRKMY